MDLTTLSKINKNTGRGGGELKAGAAGAENQSFLSRTQSAQATLTSQQANISADQAIIDAKLSQKITEAYLLSPGYLRYQKELAMQQENQAKLNTLIQKALLDSDALQKLKAKEKQLGIERTFGEGALPLAGALAGGAATQFGGKLLGKIGNPFSKGGASVADDVANAGSKGGSRLFSKVGGKALGGITAAGIDGYMEYQDNKSKGIGTGENVARTAQVAAGAGGGAWAGAATGAALGSLAGPIGTVIGGLIGGALGAWGGGALGKAAGNAEFGDKDKMVTPAKIAAVTPGNTSVTTSISNSEKFLQDKLTYMSGNLERVVDRTTRTMINTAATTKELTTLNTNTKAIMNLTKTIEALTVATYQGSRDVSVKIDGKKVAYSYNKYTENTKSTGPGISTTKNNG
jgi:hypothetical protein